MAPPAPFSLLLFTLVPLAFALRSHVPRPPRLGDGFEAASMFLRDIRLSAAYCCDLSCDCASINNSFAKQCSFIEDRLATLSPSLCANSAQNIASSMQLCAWAASGAAMLCNGGARCCSHTCREPCTSKPDVCACPCEHCSTCSCCKWVEHHHCSLQCAPCQKVWMMLDFEDQHGIPHSVNFSRNFNLNSAEAQEFYEAYASRSFVFGYFRPDEPNSVHISQIGRAFLQSAEDYPASRYWGELFGTGAVFPIFTVGVLLTGLLFALILQRRRRRADQRPLRIAWSVNRGLWIGIIWPLTILVLIIQFRSSAMSSLTKPSTLLHQMMICIGWLPLLLMWLYHIMHPQL